VTHVQGRDDAGRIISVQISPDGTPARNPAFDVTPGRLVTGLITERGIAPATAAGLAAMFPDRAPPAAVA
jgi:methylthioribose-1-phosphate isomerase